MQSCSFTMLPIREGGRVTGWAIRHACGVAIVRGHTRPTILRAARILGVAHA